MLLAVPSSPTAHSLILLIFAGFEFSLPLVAVVAVRLMVDFLDLSELRFSPRPYAFPRPRFCASLCLPERSQPRKAAVHHSWRRGHVEGDVPLRKQYLLCPFQS